MGYRLRLTLALAGLSVAGVGLLTLRFMSASYRELKADLMHSIERMTACLAGNLYWDVQAGDATRVREALERFAHGVPAPVPPVVVYWTTEGGSLRRAAAPMPRTFSGPGPRRPPARAPPPWQPRRAR